MSATGFSIASPPGHDTEAASIAGAIASLETGHGGVLLLSGEGGVGKTTLSSWAAEEARARGVVVLDAPCFALSTETPYACLVSAFGPVVRGDDGVDAGELTRGLTTLGLLFDGIAADGVEESDPAAQQLARSRLHGALATLVSRLCATGPVMLHVDDLHWADAASIEVLHALTNDLPHAALLVLATLRPFESADRQETRQLLRALRPTDWTHTIDVGGLDLDATRSLVQRRLGAVVSNRIVELVHRRSGGTPLVVEELIELMIETETLKPIGRRWELHVGDDIPVPAVADELIGDRLHRLGPESVRLVATVAIGAEPVTTAIVAAVTGRPTDGLRPALDDLRRSGVLDRAEVAGETAWVVHHPIIGEVAVDMIDAPAHAEIHRRFADRLPPGAVERRGRHLLGVGTDSLDDHDLEALLAAGRSALDRGAPGEACRLVGAVLGAIDDRGVAAHLLLDALAALGSAWTRRGEFTVAAQHLRRARVLARQHGDVVREARLLVDLQETSWIGRTDQIDFGRECDELAHRLEAAGDWVAAHLLRRYQIMGDLRAGDSATLEGLRAELERIEGHTDDPESHLWGRHLRLLSGLFRVEDAPGMLEGLDATLAAVEAHPELHRRVLHERLDLLMVLGTREQIIEGIRDERRLGERWGDWPSWRIGMASWDIAMGDGDLARAREIEELIRLTPNARPAGYVLVATALADLLTGTVDPAAPARAMAEDHLGEDRVLDHLVTIAAFLGAAHDRRASAEAVLERHEQRPFIAGFPTVGPVAAALAHLELGDRAAFDDAVRALRRFDGGAGRPSAWASVLEGEAAVDAGDRADAHLDAAARFEALHRPLDVAVCNLRALEAGAPIAADSIAAAAAIFDAAPAPWMLARLEAVAGRVSRATASTSVDHLGLTQREREVAAVVAEGLSNREVANRLFISVRTVTSHLDHIYAKLGISSRAELAERLAPAPGDPAAGNT